MTKRRCLLSREEILGDRLQLWWMLSSLDKKIEVYERMEGKSIEDSLRNMPKEVSK